MGYGTNHADVSYEAEVIEQFEKLTENIHQAETLEKSLLLKEHFNIFKEDTEGDDGQLLKELNQKLNQ